MEIQSEKIDKARKLVDKNTVEINTDTCDAIQLLKESLNYNRLVIVVGSAISSYSPTCFPTGNSFSSYIPEFLYGASAPKSDHLRNIPFEVLLCYGVSALGREQIANFICHLFENGQPNELHYVLASLLKKSRAIITTNFDNLIEDAFLGSKPTLNNYDDTLSGLGVIRISSDQNNAQQIEEVLQNKLPILFKIHGSIDKEKSLVFDINQEGRLDLWKFQIIKNIVKDADILFLGYSGIDWDILRALSENEVKIRNVIWSARSPVKWPSLFFLVHKNAKIIKEDMVTLINRISPLSQIPTLCKDNDNDYDKLRASFNYLHINDRLYWYGAILAGSGFGADAKPILEHLLLKGYQPRKNILIYLAQAEFHLGRYSDSYRYALKAAEMGTHDELSLKAMLVACNALRQKGKHLQQWILLCECHAKTCEKPTSQEHGDVLNYFAQNPISFLTFQKHKLNAKALEIREKQPLSSMLLLSSIIRTRLRLDRRTSSLLNRDNIYDPKDFHDLLLNAIRLGHATEIVNSYRDSALDLLQRSRKENNLNDRIKILEDARKLIGKSLSIARQCGDIPGLAKGWLVRKEIDRRSKRKHWSRIRHRVIKRKWKTIQMPIMLRYLRYYYTTLRVLLR